MPSPYSTPSSSRRPSLIPKQTQVRLQKHRAEHHLQSSSTTQQTVDAVIVGLGCAGVAGYLYHQARRFSPYELASLSATSLAVGYSLFNLGHHHQENGHSHTVGEIDLEDEESWKGSFQGKQFATLNTKEKIEWLRLEEARIREMQEDEQLRCGQAYIEKEQAYLAYEKHGGYGGADWKLYSETDTICRDLYKTYEKQQKRLSAIRVEIEALLAR